MATRSTRNQPFCWQEKKILRLLKSEFGGMELVKMKALYLALTEIDSDFNGKPIKFYTKTISTYSGLSKVWIPGALRVLANFRIIEIVDERDEKAQRTGREIIFTPEKMVSKPNFRKPTIRKPTIGQKTTLEDISLQEDISLGEESPPAGASLFKNHNKTKTESEVENRLVRESKDTVNVEVAGTVGNGKADIREIDQVYTEMNNAYYWLLNPSGERAHPVSLDRVMPDFKRKLVGWVNDSEYTPQDIKEAWDYYLQCWNSGKTGVHNPRVFLNNLVLIMNMKRAGIPASKLFEDWGKKQKVSE